MSYNIWKLYKYQPRKDYPSVWYFWVNPDGVIIYQRCVSSLGCMDFYIDMVVGGTIKPKPYPNMKPVKSKATQEQLSKGWLML